MPHPCTRRYSTDELLEIGRELAASLGERFTVPRFTCETGICSGTIARRFGGWAEFRKRLGLPATRGEEVGPDGQAAGRHVADEWLFERVRNACQKLGPNHTMMEFCREAGVNSTTIINRFGGWLEFRRRAGLPERDRRNWKLQLCTREELIDRVREVAAQVGPELTQKEFARRTGISVGTVLKHFDTWGQARDYAGLDPHVRRPKVYSDDFLLSDLDRVARSLGRGPTTAEYKKLGNASSETLRERFGRRWEDVLDRGRRWCEYRRAFPEKIASDAIVERPRDLPWRRPGEAGDRATD